MSTKKTFNHNKACCKVLHFQGSTIQDFLAWSKVINYLTNCNEPKLKATIQKKYNLSTMWRDNNQKGIIHTYKFAIGNLLPQILVGKADDATKLQRLLDICALRYFFHNKIA